MDLITVGIFVGLFLTGMIAGIPIGDAVGRRRQPKGGEEFYNSTPIPTFSKEETERAARIFANAFGLSRKDDVLDSEVIE